MAPKVFSDWRAIPKEARGATVALGNFDGVHLGHVAVLKAAQAARPDGNTWLVADLAVEDYWNRFVNKAAGDEAMRKGEHPLFHHKLSVRRRKDRHPLLVLFEQKKQIMQIVLAKFQNESDAKSILTKIADKYQNNDIKKEELKAQRDVMINDFFEAQGGRSRPQGQTLRRKASAARAEMDTANEAMADVKTSETQLADTDILSKPPPSPPSRSFVM